VRCDGIWKPTPKHLRRMCKNCDISSKLRIRGGCPAIPGAGQKVPLFILDRACSGHQWQPCSACHLRSHRISRRCFEGALDLYRARFKPSRIGTAVVMSAPMSSSPTGRPKHGVCSLSPADVLVHSCGSPVALPQPVDDLKRMRAQRRSKP